MAKFIAPKKPELKIAAETKIEIKGNMDKNNAVVKVSATPVMVPSKADRNKIPEKVNFRHILKHGKSPFHSDKTLDLINKTLKESLEKGTPITKIRKYRGKDVGTLTEQEKKLQLEFSVLFAKDKNQIVPVTLYLGKVPDVEPKAYDQLESTSFKKPSEGQGYFLGKGAFGRVKIGYDEKNQRWVAVKIQEFDEKNQADDIERAREEKELAKKGGGVELSRADIERTHEKTGHLKLYQVQDILGKELFTYLEAPANQTEARVNSVGERLDIALQMAKEVAYAHNKGLIHRDIKCENFLYNKENRKVKLIDWGIGADIEKYIKKGSIESPNDEERKVDEPNNYVKIKDSFKGTSEYIAPEIYAGGIYSRQSDIFALGVTFQDLFELHKEMGKNPNNKFLQDFVGHDKLPLDTEDRLINLIAKMVSEKSVDRGTITEVIKEIEYIKLRYEAKHGVEKKEIKKEVEVKENKREPEIKEKKQEPKIMLEPKVMPKAKLPPGGLAFTPQTPEFLKIKLRQVGHKPIVVQPVQKPIQKPDQGAVAKPAPQPKVQPETKQPEKKAGQQNVAPKPQQAVAAQKPNQGVVAKPVVQPKVQPETKQPEKKIAHQNLAKPQKPAAIQSPPKMGEQKPPVTGVQLLKKQIEDREREEKKKMEAQKRKNPDPNKKPK